jgi:hypothetical protein
MAEQKKPIGPSPMHVCLHHSGMTARIDANQELLERGDERMTRIEAKIDRMLILSIVLLAGLVVQIGVLLWTIPRDAPKGYTGQTFDTSMLEEGG